MQTTIYSVGVKSSPRGNASGYTGSDYANDIAAKINKHAMEQDTSENRRWFEREIENCADAIGAERLYIIEETIEVEE